MNKSFFKLQRTINVVQLDIIDSNKVCNYVLNYYINYCCPPLFKKVLPNIAPKFVAHFFKICVGNNCITIIAKQHYLNI